MKAILFDRFGSTDVLREADIEVPQPGPGQIRVRVRAAGLNALDGKIRSGAMEAAFPTRKGPTPIAGGRVHGVVRAGALTTGFYFADRWAACSRMRRRVHRRRPFWR